MEAVKNREKIALVVFRKFWCFLKAFLKKAENSLKKNLKTIGAAT